jgi:hypothetical protein
MMYSQKQEYMKEAAKGSRGGEESQDGRSDPVLSKKQNPLVSSNDRTLILCKDWRSDCGLREKSDCDFPAGEANACEFLSKH